MKKYVSATLYKEGVRRTRAMGIVLLLIFVMFNTLPMMIYISQSHFGAFRDSFTRVQVLTHMEIAPLLILFIFLGPILFTMSLFSFLNKRRASDFYHAIPYTRKSVFISFSLAIYTWLAIIIGSSVLVNSFLAYIYPGYEIHLSSVLFAFITLFLGAILVTNVMMLAKSISGTGLTNLVIGGMIGFYPSIIQSLFYSLLEEITRILPMEGAPLLWNLNIPIRAIFFLDRFMFVEESFLESMIFPLIYTFILALIYFVLTVFLFHKRKSETAERAAPSKGLQHLFRCLLVFPLTLIVTGFIIIEVVTGEYNMYTSGVLFFLLCFIPIIYFTYELLTTRKPKNLILAIPVFGFVILANIIFTAGLYVAREIVWSNAPSAEQIVGIRDMRSSSADWAYRKWGTHPSYNYLLTRDLYIHNERLHGYIAQEIEATISRARRGEPDIVRARDGSTIDGRSHITVSILLTNGRTIERRVPLISDQRNYLQFNAGLSDSIYAENLTKLPDFSSNVDFGLNLRYSGPDLSVDDSFDWQQFWEMYAREYEGLTKHQQALHNGMRFQQQLFNFDMHFQNQEDVFFTITFNGKIEDESFTSIYQVTRQTPETLAFLIEELSSRYEQEVIDLLTQVQEAEGMLQRIESVIISSEMHHIIGTDSDIVFHYCEGCGNPAEVDFEQLQEIVSLLLEEGFSESVDISQELFQLSLRPDEDTRFRLFINISSDTLEKIEEIVHRE